MAETLHVHINRESVHSVEAPRSFESTGSFTIAIENHGTATHVHLHLDDALSRAASLDAVNHYVEAGDTREVTVAVADVDGDEFRGGLDVFTGYGAQRASVPVSVSPPSVVAVDEALSTPAAAADDGVGDRLGRENLLLAGIALGVVVLTVALSAIVSETIGILIGLLALAVGVGVAVYLSQSG